VTADMKRLLPILLLVFSVGVGADSPKWLQMFNGVGDPAYASELRVSDKDTFMFLAACVTHARKVQDDGRAREIFQMMISLADQDRIGFNTWLVMNVSKQKEFLRKSIGHALYRLTNEIKSRRTTWAKVGFLCKEVVGN